METSPGLVALIACLAGAGPALAQVSATGRDALFAAVFDASVPDRPLAPAAYPVLRGRAAIDAPMGAVNGPSRPTDSVSLPPVGPNGSIRWQPQADPGYDLTLERQWPAAVQIQAGEFNLDLSPHAGLVFSEFGKAAEAGATLRIGREDAPARNRLAGLSVRDGRAFGDQGRWYLFAAVSGKAVGLNVTRGDDGDWRRAGWSADPSSALVGDGQLGIGWRKGGMQAAFGYVHREIKVQQLAPRRRQRRGRLHGRLHPVDPAAQVDASRFIRPVDREGGWRPISTIYWANRSMVHNM